MATGFTDSFTSGEISDDAWDRTDIQPVAKGCERAENYVVRIAGPLAKRRGFWRLGDAFDSHHIGRLIPFRRSIDDALMLEFAHLTCRVWNNDGSPLIDPATHAQVIFTSPYSEADLKGMRYKQVNDVIYLRNAAGLTPLTLTRLRNDFWRFSVETFPDGPWRPENLDRTFTLTLAGADEADVNPATGAGSFAVGTAVTLTASAALFDPGQVGAMFRLRQTDGLAPVSGWKPGFHPSAVGVYNVSNMRVYKCTAVAAHDETVSNPPVHQTGVQSDGGNSWAYVHDGAGIVQLTAVTDATHASGIVTKTLPLKAGATSYWAEGAYSVFRGWPRAWPGLREERLVEGATASNLDFVDLSETAGFDPLTETFKPGLGTGQVLATDAVRRRVGDDGAEILWFAEASYLICGTASGEHLIAGGVLDEAITPSTVVVKNLTAYGSADVYPAKAHKALIHVTRGGQTLRELEVNAQQQATSDDLTVLAQHIAQRGFSQLGWVPQPDETLWLRLTDETPGDGGVAVMTYHKDQSVRGFSSVRLPAGFVCEDLAVLPGPGRLETLWGIFSRVKAGFTQRELWMLSARTDALYGMDCAALYAGAGATVIAGLDHLEGESVRILADGIEVPPQVVTAGKVVLTTAASRVYVGLPWTARFKSLKLDRAMGGSLNARQRVVGCTVSLKTALARIGLEIDGVAQPTETVSPRTAADVPAPSAKRTIQNVTLAGDTARDPRLTVEDDSAYEGLIYSLKPQVVVGA